MTEKLLTTKEEAIEETAEQIEKTTHLTEKMARTLISQSEDKSQKEISKEYGISPSSIRRHQEDIKERKQKAQKTIDLIVNEGEISDQDVENTFITLRAQKILNADQNRTYTFKENLMDRMKENPGLKTNTRQGIAEKLGERPEYIGESKALAKRIKKKSEKTIDLVEKHMESEE